MNWTLFHKLLEDNTIYLYVKYYKYIIRQYVFLVAIYWILYFCYIFGEDPDDFSNMVNSLLVIKLLFIMLLVLFHGWISSSDGKNKIMGLIHISFLIFIWQIAFNTLIYNENCTDFNYLMIYILVIYVLELFHFALYATNYIISILITCKQYKEAILLNTALLE